MTPTSLHWLFTLAALSTLLLSTSMTRATERDFSETLDQLWEFDSPAASETRFRAEVTKHPAGSREAHETATQIARSLGLQRKFSEADAVLDTLSSSIEQSLSRVRVRYFLERGRVLNSSNKQAEAVPLFKQALKAALNDALPGADFYRVDALHMLGIASPPNEQLGWNLEALFAADASSDERARGWRAPLLHNIGWTYHGQGDYAAALRYWQKALAAREASGDKKKTQIAKWTVARGLRSLDRLDEAEKIQRELIVETETAGAPDGFVYEELAEIAIARNDLKGAKAWAAKAYQYLKDDRWLVANEKARLDRLARVGGLTSE